MPYPHTLSISHKLRVLIKFDQTLSKERDLQLSFPISIHPTLDEDGSPVHPDVNYVPRERRRRRRGHALYGIDTRQRSEDASDDDEAPLPMYADREDTLLLMVGQTAYETAMEEALELAMAAAYPEGTTPHSPSEDSLSSISRSPITPLYPLVLTPIQGEQHAWGDSSRRSSLIPTCSPTHLTSSSPASRRHSHHGYPLDEPPPYVMPSRTEEPLSRPLTVHCPPSSPPLLHSFSQSPTSETSEPGGAGDEDTSSIASPTMTVAEIFDPTTENSTHLGRLGSRIKKAIDKGKSRATGERGSRSVTVVTTSSSSASSSSSSANRSGPASSSSHTGSSSRPSPGLLPSPLYEIQEEILSYPGDDGCVRPLCTIPASRTNTCSSSSSKSSSSSSSPSSSSSSSSSSSDCSEPSPLPSGPRDQDKESTLSPGYVTTVSTETESRPGYTSSCSTAR